MKNNKQNQFVNTLILVEFTFRALPRNENETLNSEFEYEVVINGMH